MRGGDLSNRIVPRVIIRMNETLFEQVPVDNMFNRLKSKLGLTVSTKYQVRQEALYFLDKLIVRSNYNVHLIFIHGEDKDYEEKVRVIKEDTLIEVNILTYNTKIILDRYLDTCNTFLVDTDCYRNNIYTLEEAIQIFR